MEASQRNAVTIHRSLSSGEQSVAFLFVEEAVIMQCKCGSKLNVTDTACKGITTFRKFKCPGCGKVRFSYEKLVSEEDEEKVKKKLSSIRSRQAHLL